MKLSLWFLLWFLPHAVLGVCIRELEPFVGAVLRNTSLDFALHFPTGLYDDGWGGLGLRSESCADDASCMSTTNFIIFTKRTLLFAELAAGAPNGRPKMVDRWTTPISGIAVSNSRLCCIHGLAIDVELSFIVSAAAIERNITLLYAYGRDDWPSPHVGNGHITLSVKSLGQLTPNQQCLTTGGDAIAVSSAHALRCTLFIQSLSLAALSLASLRSPLQ
jgi:hypothetical protein